MDDKSKQELEKKYTETKALAEFDLMEAQLGKAGFEISYPKEAEKLRNFDELFEEEAWAYAEKNLDPKCAGWIYVFVLDAGPLNSADLCLVKIGKASFTPSTHVLYRLNNEKKAFRALGFDPAIPDHGAHNNQSLEKIKTRAGNAPLQQNNRSYLAALITVPADLDLGAVEKEVRNAFRVKDVDMKSLAAAKYEEVYGHKLNDDALDIILPLAGAVEEMIYANTTTMTKLRSGWTAAHQRLNISPVTSFTYKTYREGIWATQ
jgi:hypothetical protein